MGNRSRANTNKPVVEGQDEHVRWCTAIRLADAAFIALLREHHPDRETPLVDNVRD